MDRQVKEPSDVLSEFLNYIDRIRYDYKAAHDAVKKEEKRLQDLLHELEFAEGENEKRWRGNGRRSVLLIHVLIMRITSVRHAGKYIYQDISMDVQV